MFVAAKASRFAAPFAAFQPFKSLGLIAAYQMLRAVPGTREFRRGLRDSAWLSEADATVVSFPKSGRTYVRAMLARLYQRRFGIDERALLEFPLLRRGPEAAPRLFFTHAGDAMRRPDEISIDPSDYAHTRLVLLARHPGDIAISRYHHLQHRSSNRARKQLAEQPLEAFIWTEQGGIPSIVHFLNQFARIPGIMIIEYESFLLDPAKALTKLASGIWLDVTREDIDDAVEFALLSNLRKLEREGYFTSSRLRRHRKDDDKSGKVRNGSSGSYRTDLSPGEAGLVESYLHEHLDARFHWPN
jgi:hypothetical protein